MIRPVERFEVNIGGARLVEEPAAPRIGARRAGAGPLGLAAAACLGATGALAIQRLIEQHGLLEWSVRLFRSVLG
ncbi:MAG: hypothetical protein NZ555_03555 [Geminicoccaceae bacterium]|nr:hypothetical protein [Geminicoccaceae bacterium]MCX8101012.1 hypothetical protein [Geminicoccaceae bacterium]MDW8370378.1 hypothetical protein [Geminicoccaceae bacterium]